MSVTFQDAAARLIADLMPIAIVVADAGGSPAAADFVQALEAAGAGAEVFAPGAAAPFDLAVLLADPNPSRHAGLPALIESLAVISDGRIAPASVPEPTARSSQARPWAGVPRLMTCRYFSAGRLAIRAVFCSGSPSISAATTGAGSAPNV